MLLYYITDRSQFPGDEHARRSALLEKIAEAASCGVDLIQLREKDLSSRDLEGLAGEAASKIRRHSGSTRLLINSRTDIAIACGADGVHLRSGDVSPEEVRAAWKASTTSRAPYVGVSCHSREDVAKAVANRADFAVLAPVFEKKDVRNAVPTGLAGLREAARERIAVIALGGITLENAQKCMEAGAAGIAGIRLFQEGEMGNVVRKLRP